MGTLGFLDADHMNQGQLDPRQDVHALRLVLYNLIVGTPREAPRKFFARVIHLPDGSHRSFGLKVGADFEEEALDPILGLALTSKLARTVPEYRRRLEEAFELPREEFLLRYGKSLAEVAASSTLGIFEAAEDVLFSTVLCENFPDGLGLDQPTALAIALAAAKIRQSQAPFLDNPLPPMVMTSRAKYGTLRPDIDGKLVPGPNPYLHYDLLLKNVADRMGIDLFILTALQFPEPSMCSEKPRSD